MGGFINSTRCNSYLASIDANTRALAAAEALQSEAEMAQLRAQIAADRTAAAAIAGCHPPT